LRKYPARNGSAPIVSTVKSARRRYSQLKKKMKQFGTPNAKEFVRRVSDGKTEKIEKT
jgi:hypothetical protein